jgi:hypothetical protein
VPGGDAVKPRAAHPPSAHAGRTCLPALSWGVIEADYPCYYRTATANSTARIATAITGG